MAVTAPQLGPTHATVTSRLRDLVRDRYVQLQIGTTILIALLYVLPILTPSQLASFSRKWLCLPLMIWPTIGCFANLGAVPSIERGAWKTLGVTCACWLTALAVVAWWPANAWSPVENTLTAVLYMAYYLFAIPAIGAMPMDGVTRGDSSLERRLARLGLIIFVSVWVLYIVVLPGVLQQRFSGEVVVDSPMSIVLGLAVIVQAALRWRRAVSPRSRAIAAAFVTAASALLLTDLLNWASVLDFVHFGDAQWTDAFWTLPSLALIALVRVRHGSFPPSESARDAALVRDSTPISLGITLMFGGLSFLLVDSLLRLSGFVGSGGRAATIAIETTLIVGSLSMMTLAAFAHSLLNERSERRGTRLQQSPDGDRRHERHVARTDRAGLAGSSAPRDEPRRRRSRGGHDAPAARIQPKTRRRGDVDRHTSSDRTHDEHVESADRGTDLDRARP